MGGVRAAAVPRSVNMAAGSLAVPDRREVGVAPTVHTRWILLDRPVQRELRREPQTILGCARRPWCSNSTRTRGGCTRAPYSGSGA
jgi:hypothetical protein